MTPAPTDLLAHISLKTDGKRGELLIDGQPARGATHVHLDAPGGELPRVTVTQLAGHVLFQGEAIIRRVTEIFGRHGAQLTEQAPAPDWERRAQALLADILPVIRDGLDNANEVITGLNVALPGLPEGHTASFLYVLHPPMANQPAQISPVEAAHD